MPSLGRNPRQARENVIGTIINAASQHGVDPALLLAVASVESSFNPGAVGDQGTSFGLFQNHVGGAGGPTVQSARRFLNPVASARNAAERFSQHQGGATPGDIAYSIQRPANREEYVRRVNEAYSKFSKRSDIKRLIGITTTQPQINTQLVPTSVEINRPISSFGTPLTPTTGTGKVGQPIRPVSLQPPQRSFASGIGTSVQEQTVIDPSVQIGKLGDHGKIAKSMGLSMISGFRPGSTVAGTGKLDDHSRGKAYDYSGDFNTMNEFANRMRGTQGVKYIIFNNRISNGSIDNWAWRPYSHPGGKTSPTARHEDHVHISLA